MMALLDLAGYPSGIDERTFLRDCHNAPAVKDYLKANGLKPTLTWYGRKPAKKKRR